MLNTKFTTVVSIKHKKSSNASIYTSKLVYSASILQLFLKTHNLWSDFNHTNQIKLLYKLLSNTVNNTSQPVKHPYFKVTQLEFEEDFSIFTQHTPLYRDLFDSNTVERLDKPIFFKTNKLLALFKSFMVFNTAFATKKSPAHADYRLIYLINSSSGRLQFVNMIKLFARWVDLFHLLVNIFLYRTNLMAFGSVTFKEELVALNWTLSTFKYRFFKYATPYFFSKDSSYGSQQSSTFFNLIHNLGYKVLFILSIRDLEKTVHFLRAIGFYMIAPIPYNMSPWSVSFPVPVVVNNLFTQLFFLKFVTFAQQKAYSTRFSLYSKYWF